MVLTTFAGTPATTVFGGTSFVTTAPAATTAPSPTVTPGRIVECDPIQTLLPILIGAETMLERLDGYISWFSVASTTMCPMSTSSPISMPPWSWKQHPELMKTFLPTLVLIPQLV